MKFSFLLTKINIIYCSQIFNFSSGQTSVTVNTITPSLDLSYGAVAKAILKKAGNKLQKEVWTYSRKCKWGDVLKTKGYDLSSEFVYHVLCADRTSGIKVEQVCDIQYNLLLKSYSVSYNSTNTKT